MLASAAVVLLGLTGVAAFGIAPDTVVDPVPATLTVRDLPLPAIADAAAPGPQAPFWREERVRRGDTIVTSGGLIGKVTRVEDAQLEVEIAPGVKVKIVRATVSNILSKTEPAPEA